MTDIFFRGQVGRIEGEYTQSRIQDAPVALLLHPYSVSGSESMNNPIITELYDQFGDLGFSVLRINFRGVGKSEGTYDRGFGERLDASVALDWLLDANKSPSMVWVAGCSFGAWIAMEIVMRRPEITHFISVSTPCNVCDFSFLAPCPVPGLLIHGDQDSLTSEAHIQNLVEKLTKQQMAEVEYIMINGADHMFRKHRSEFRNIVRDYVQKQKSIYKPPSYGQTVLLD